VTEQKKPWALTAWWRRQWAHWWFKLLVLLVTGWLVRALPAGVQRGIDAYNATVVVSVSGSNYHARAIDFFQLTTLRGTPAGGGGIFPRKPPMAKPTYSGLVCCRELQLRYDDRLLVKWRYDVSKDEYDRGIRPPPAREAIVPIEIDDLPLDRLTALHVYFFETGEVAVKLSDLRGVEETVPTLRTPSRLAQPGFDRETP
jgi:hypothetical protein